MARYAENTTVGSEQSRQEIEKTLRRYGATAFYYGWEEDRAVLGFESHSRRVQFELPMPSKDAPEFTRHSRGQRTAAAAEQRWEQATRQRWRALSLVVKAKLEAVETGITTFEEEFLAHIVVPGPEGRPVRFGALALPAVAEAYAGREMPALLPGG